MPNLTDIGTIEQTRPGEMSEWARLAKSGDVDALRRLALILSSETQQCVERCVKRTPALISHREDMEAEVLWALKELVEAYEPTSACDLTVCDRLFENYIHTRFARTLARHCHQFFSKDEQGTGLDEVLFSEMPRTWEPLDSVDVFKEIEDREAVNSAIAKLPVVEQQVIRLYYYEDMNQEQVAEFVGIDTKSVQVLLRTAYGRLRTHLEGTL